MASMDPEAAIVAVPLSGSTSQQNMEAETDAERFQISLRELKDLRSQLHFAADYCQSAFVKAERKKLLCLIAEKVNEGNSKLKRRVLNSTKSYICQAIVTVVDHLGSVSAKVESQLKGNIVSQTEQRIDRLKQRLLTCQQYAMSLDISTVRLSTKFLRHQQRYFSPLVQTLENTNGVPRDGPTDSEVQEVPSKKVQIAAAFGPPRIIASLDVRPPDTHINSRIDPSATLPVIRAPPVLTRPCNPLFGSFAEGAHMLGEGHRKKKHPQGNNNFMAFLWRSKRRV